MAKDMAASNEFADGQYDMIDELSGLSNDDVEPTSVDSSGSDPMSSQPEYGLPGRGFSWRSGPGPANSFRQID
jgi:hypothetical protein